MDREVRSEHGPLGDFVAFPKTLHEAPRVEQIRTNGDLQFDRENSLSSRWVREQRGHAG